MPSRSLTYTVEVKPSSAWNAIASGHILQDGIGGSFATSSGDDPLGFGDAADATLDIDLLLSDIPEPWYLTPVRVIYTFSDTGATTAFNGIILNPDGDMSRKSTLHCGGFKYLVSTTKAYSPIFYNRPVATQTTGTSVEDPASGSYRAGVINWVLWQSGGRPYEQSASYPSAKFYYSCDRALIAPPYSWVAGDDGWSEIVSRAQDSGGQIYQDELGVIRYRQPLSFGAGSPLATFDESVYGNVTWSYPQTAAWATGAVIVNYINRDVQTQQEVVNDATPRLIKPSETLTFDLEPKLPLYSLVTSGKTCDDGFVMVNLFADVMTVGTHYSRTITWSAQKISVTIQNLTSSAMVLHKIIMYGRPLAAGEAGNYTLGTHVDGVPDRVAKDSEMIQNIVQAERVARLIKTFYGTLRKVYVASDCPYLPGVRIGDTVNFSCDSLGVSTTRCLVTAYTHANVAGKADYTLVPVGDLPTSDDLFQFNTTYADATVKKLGY